MGTRNIQSASARLAKATSHVLETHREELTRIKGKADKLRERQESIWGSLLLAMATLGNARGDRLVSKDEFHDSVKFQALSARESSEIASALQEDEE